MLQTGIYSIHTSIIKSNSETQKHKKSPKISSVVSSVEHSKIKHFSHFRDLTKMIFYCIKCRQPIENIAFYRNHEKFNYKYICDPLKMPFLILYSSIKNPVNKALSDYSDLLKPKYVIFSPPNTILIIPINQRANTNIYSICSFFYGEL